MQSPLTEADGLAGRARRRSEVSVAPRTRPDPFPRRAPHRWLLRLVFALPFVGIAIWDRLAGGLSTGLTVNEDLAARIGQFAWTRADVAWVGDLYPPVGTVVAAVVPGGALGLGIAGAVVSGVFLQQMVQVMVQRRFPRWRVIAFTVALGANPLYAYTVTTNFEAFLGIVFFGFGMVDMVRFIVNRNTQAGFRAGILFMMAALSSASGIVFVVVAGLAAPLLTLARRGQRGARAANILVILFPTLFTFIAVFFLQFVFLRAPFQVITEQAHYDPTRWALVPMLYTSLSGFLIATPVISGWALALLVRRPGAILISTLLFAGLVFGYVFDLIPLNAAGNTFLIMTMTGIAILPASNSRLSPLITVVAGLQIVIAWTDAFNRPVVLDWMGSLGRVIGVSG